MLQVAEIAEQVGAAAWSALGRGWGRGSGVVVGAEPGAHQRARPARPGRRRRRRRPARPRARAVAADPKADLAVIAADTGDARAGRRSPAAPARLGATWSSRSPTRAGAACASTHGYVAAEPRRAIEHTAPLPRGASGGPLLDAEGRLLGLNTVRAEGGFILAVPVTRARADALARGELPQRAQLGVAVSRGLIVRAVQDASPAAVAGVAPGDRLLAVDDRPLRSLDDLLDALEREPAHARPDRRQRATSSATSTSYFSK